MLGSLLKAAVGVATLPVAAVKDVVTLGGELTNEESAVAKSCRTIGKNMENAVKPDDED